MLRLKSRRSRRIDLDVPVVVHRPPNEGPRFSENTKTLVVNAHGALLALKGMVAPRQKLFLQNKASGGTTRVPGGLRESRNGGAAHGCCGVHKARAELLAGGVSACRLDYQRLGQQGRQGMQAAPNTRSKLTSRWIPWARPHSWSSTG